MDAAREDDSSPSKEPPRGLGAGQFYFLRVATVVMVLGAVAARDAVCGETADYPLGLFLLGLLYPHLLQVAVGRIEGRHDRRPYSLLADGFFAGVAMPAFGFGLAPCVVLLAINLFNWLAVGGVRFILPGGALMLAGLGVSGAWSAFGADSKTCVAADISSYAILLLYLVAVGVLVHKRAVCLQQRCDDLLVAKDAAEIGWQRAERALIAVLPPSVAPLAAGGGVATRHVAEATLLLADFAGAGGRDGHIAQQRVIFDACDEILARHGLEMVKTFGRRWLAMAGEAAGPEAAVAAALEISAFLQDHEAAAGVRLVIHCGPAEAGLVQAEKFNYDVIGPAVDELLALAALPTEAKVVISAAAKDRLQRAWRLAPLPGAGTLAAFTPAEHGGA